MRNSSKMVALSPLDKKKWHLTCGWWLTSAAAEDRSIDIFWGVGTWKLRSLPTLLNNCVKPHVDLYCVRSVRVSSSSDR